MFLKYQGYRIPSAFGVAQSTLEYIINTLYIPPMEIYLSIDRGASFTDFVIINSHSEIIKTECLRDNKWNRVIEIYRILKNRYNPDSIVFTGSTNKIPEELRNEIHQISEIDAIAFGGAFLSSRNRCIVVSMGTGTAVVLFDNGKASHIGGTGIGGGTVSGLGSLILSESDPLIINKLASKGNSSEINLTLSDIGYESVGFLSGDITASNFGNLKSDRREDKAAALLAMTAEVIGVTASLSARIHNLENEIVVTGNLSGSDFIKKRIETVGNLYGTSFIFPENPEYEAEIGDVAKYLKTL
ncbi:MAG: hypothetical protein L3J12_07880, partial [Spirochaetales bacterium]|nr:hypothetical protein [Spirochaetales bacterium]